MFVHLHTHSYYSLLEALPAPGELVESAHSQGMPALALTDHTYLTGAIAFYDACQNAGIKPILGLEINLLPPAELHLPTNSGGYPFVLLAMDLSGWANLCRLSSHLLISSGGDAFSPCPLGKLMEYSGGIIALTGGTRSLLDHLVGHALTNEALQFLGVLKQIFPDRLYVEIMQPNLDTEIAARRLAALADKASLPVAATQDVFYRTPPEQELQATLTAMRLNCRLANLPDQSTAPAGSFFTSAETMAARFAWLPQAIANTETIASRCQLELPLGKARFPKIPLPPDTTAIQVLTQKAYRGAQRIYGKITPEIQFRLDHELEVIAERGFEPIFLIMEELLDYARKVAVPFSSRGSAASSLVAHCLGITIPDPLKHDLYFERFLNPARSTPPDIDTDLCSRRRDIIIQHVFDTYGEDQVAMVGTINRFRPRSALGEVAKALGFPKSDVRRLVESLPYFFHGVDADQRNDPFGSLKASHSGERYQTLFQQAEAILRQPRHLSVHAGGIIVSPGSMTDLVPVMQSGSKGVRITQFDLESIERLGLVKIDLLGIRGLTVLGDVAEGVFSWRKKDFARPLDVLASIPEDDPDTSDRIEKGTTIGCFQIESPGMRTTLREIRARTVEDIIAALALYRPGPLQGGLRDAFVRRYKKEEPITHLHPAMAPLLDDTYGVILYQEQVLRIAHELAGLSLAEADLLRRAMSHFDPGNRMDALRQKFLQGALEKSGIPTETAERVWEMMTAFAGYGFPKAHAASYALVAWQSAWCKSHFPAEFMAAVMANWGGYYSQRVYLMEARRMGLTVRPPQINHARPEFSVAYPNGEPVLYMGLDQVFGLTRRSQQRILNQRPFQSLDDFLARVDPRRQEAENLIRCGALEGFGNIPDILQQLEHGSWKLSQPSLFSLSSQNQPDWTLQEKSTAQQEILGVSLDTHPLENYVAQIAGSGAITTVEAAGRLGKKVVVAGVRQTSRRARTSRGDIMFFLSIEDLEGMLDVVFFPNAYQSNRASLTGNGPFLISGTMELDETRGEAILRAEQAYNLATL